MRYSRRRPNFSVSIIRPDYYSDGSGYRQIAWFPSDSVMTGGSEVSSALLSYQYSESLATPGTQFSLTLTPEHDKNGKTWIDKLRIRDVVVITEFGHDRYVGVISQIRYSGRMDDTPNRTISVSGMSIGGVLQSFKMVMDQYVYQYNSTVQSANSALQNLLQSEMAVGGSMKNIMVRIYESYMDLMAAAGGSSRERGLFSFLDDYIDYESGIDGRVTNQYPVKFSLYQAGENDIWSIWEGIITRPFQELYGRWNHGLKAYSLNFRQAPFDSQDWASLRGTEIDPLYVKSMEIGRTDQDVFTFFATTFPGSGISRETALAVEQYAQYVVLDEERWSLYGYRPMEAVFKFFKQSDAGTVPVTDVMKRMNDTLSMWYRYNPDFLTGTIETMTVEDAFPAIGEKILFLGGEFYLEEISRSWSYGGPMVTRLSVTRGAQYRNGAFFSKIVDIGKYLKTETTT